jgi:putative peptide zinc metalloprotease protein
LITSLVINTVFFLTNDDFGLLLTNWERFFAILISFIILIFHEVGHIIGAKNYNVNVKESGIGLYFILPVFYVNLNESWKLERKKRVIINLSGAYFQSLIGVLIIALMLFSTIKTDFLWYLFIINFLIIFINLNPFIKFDGYWVLSDLLKENNLDELSTDFFKNPFNRKKVFPLRIKVYAICKAIFLAGLFGFLFYGLYKFIHRSIIEDNITNFYILIGGFLLIVMANLINYRYGFSKKKTGNQRTGL